MVAIGAGFRPLETGANDGLGGRKPRKLGLSGKSLRLETRCPDCVAARKGLEPLTLALGKPCSIRLSYRAARAGGW